MSNCIAHLKPIKKPLENQVAEGVCPVLGSSKWDDDPGPLLPLPSPQGSPRLWLISRVPAACRRIQKESALSLVFSHTRHVKITFTIRSSDGETKAEHPAFIAPSHLC